MTDLERAVLAAHADGPKDVLMVTQEKRAQIRLAKKGFLIRWFNGGYKITPAGRAELKRVAIGIGDGPEKE